MKTVERTPFQGMEWLTLVENVWSGDASIHCARCGRREPFGCQQEWRATWDVMDRIAARHEHSARPLTPAEREQARRLETHRRGAWRLL